MNDEVQMPKAFAPTGKDVKTTYSLIIFGLDLPAIGKRLVFSVLVIRTSLVIRFLSFVIRGGAGLGLLCSHPAAAAASSLVWPPPPDAPRIAYVGSLGSPEDLGVKRSALGKIGNWLAGTRRESDHFVKPFGVALDEQDNLCFTDTGAKAVCYFDHVHKKWQRWEQAGKIRFESPVAVARRAGVFYVADSGLASVLAFNEQGQLLFQLNAGLERPTGLAVVSNRLFVVDSQLQQVLSFDLQGRPTGHFGRRGAGEGEFNFPTHISADIDGNLVVTDSLNGRIQIFDLQGRFLRQVGSLGDAPGRFSRPKGAAADSFGHLYVVDASFENVQLFDREGRLLMALGQSGSQPGEFWLPNGIAISSANEVYVADSYNQRIQIFKFIGQP